MSTPTTTLAGNAGMAFPQPVQLFAGDLDVTTNRRQVADGITLAKYEVIAVVGDKIVKYNPAATDGSQNAAGIMPNAVDTTAVTGQWSAFYTGGDFNHAALVWPSSLDTLAKRRAVFATTSKIAISSVL